VSLHNFILRVTAELRTIYHYITSYYVSLQNFILCITAELHTTYHCRPLYIIYHHRTYTACITITACPLKLYTTCVTTECYAICHYTILYLVCLFITYKLCVSKDLSVSRYNNGIFTTVSALFSQSGSTIHISYLVYAFQLHTITYFKCKNTTFIKKCA
jgi:hypothetical protein